jgi:hypothetical protein
MEKLERLLTHCTDRHNQRYMNFSFLIIHEEILPLFMDQRKMGQIVGAPWIYGQSMQVSAIYELCKFALSSYIKQKSECRSGVS